MKHRLILALTLTAALFATVAATAIGGPKGQLFQFRGDLLNASSSNVQVQVDGGNHAALRALIGQSQNQTFTIGPSTEILVWSHGIPHVGNVTDLKQGDNVQINVRAPHGSPLQTIEATAAGTVGDHGQNTSPASKPLYLYVGTVTGPQSGGHIALHVSSGNWRGLQSMLGQPLDQSFSYDDGTIFLLWQGKVPTVIDASHLQAGDRITVRVRAPRNATLAQVEASPAKHVGDHEPGDPSKQS
jgi:hypothetical protein